MDLDIFFMLKFCLFLFYGFLYSSNCMSDFFNIHNTSVPVALPTGIKALHGPDINNHLSFSAVLFPR